MTWNVVPPPFTHRSSNKTLWSSSFIELALNSWVNAHEHLPSNGMMLLFHVIHVNMFVSVPMVQNLVVAYLKRCGSSKKNSGLRRPEARTVGRLPEELALKEIFLDSQSRGKAIWHARRMLHLAEQSFEAMNGSPNNGDHHGRVNGNGREADVMKNPNLDETEPPHFSHCVTIAVLVLWSDAMLVSGQNEQVSSVWPRIGSKVLDDPIGDSSRIKGLFRSIFVDMLACVCLD